MPFRNQKICETDIGNMSIVQINLLITATLCTIAFLLYLFNVMVVHLSPGDAEVREAANIVLVGGILTGAYLFITYTVKSRVYWERTYLKSENACNTFFLKKIVTNVIQTFYGTVIGIALLTFGFGILSISFTSEKYITLYIGEIFVSMAIMVLFFIQYSREMVFITEEIFPIFTQAPGDRLSNEEIRRLQEAC